MTKLIKHLKMALWLVVSTLIAVILILYVAGIIADFIENEKLKEVYLSHPVISKQDYGERYLKDLIDYKWEREFAEYINFKEKDYKSPSINIKNGVRSTEYGDCEAAESVVFYGGSTTLGVGVNDGSTIPSFFAKKINKNKCNYRVINKGGGWQQSTQENIKFYLDLDKENKIRHAIFLDLINDIDVVTFGGIAGSIDPMAESKFNFNANAYKKIDHIKIMIYANPAIQFILKKFNAPKTKNAKSKVSLSEEEIKLLGNQIIRIFNKNLRVRKAMCTEFKVHCITFLQPFPLTQNKTFSKNEMQMMRARIGESDYEMKLIQYVYDNLSPQFIGINEWHKVIDLRKIFYGNKQELFVDAEHLLPAGNEIIAGKILSYFGD